MGGEALDDGPTGMKAPDGGWGWAVLFGCFIITGFSYAFPRAISVFFTELTHEFGVGYNDCAWISSILLAMLYGTGPLCSVLVNRFGCRPVMMVGGLFAALGMIIAYFATSIIHIYFSTGVITGLGLALNFQPSLIMLNRYFSEKRPLANGLAAAGSPVALCCLSPLGQVLQDQFGWRGGFLILGGMLLNCCACGALMRPLVPPKVKEDQETRAKVVEEPKPTAKLLDFSVFKDRGFVIYTVAATIMVLGLFVPSVFMVSYAKELGNEDTKSALLLTIVGFVDMLVRPACGFIAGLKWVRPRCTYFFGFAMLFNGCSSLVGSQSKDYSVLVVYCVFFGLSYGMVGALQFEVLMAIVGSQKFSSAIGLVLLVEAIAVLVGLPGAGKLLDHTHNYMYVFMLAGAELSISAFVLTISNLICLRKKPQEPELPAKMEMAVTDTEMDEPIRAIQEEHQERGGEEGHGGEQYTQEAEDSVRVDSVGLEKVPREEAEINGSMVEPDL